MCDRKKIIIGLIVLTLTLLLELVLSVSKPAANVLKRHQCKFSRQKKGGKRWRGKMAKRGRYLYNHDRRLTLFD